MSRPVLAAVGVGKRFGGTAALDGVDLELAAGSVHALVGENGAGKSTLASVLSGVLRPDVGELRVDGDRVTFRSPVAALAHGVALISQELSLLPMRSVLDNVFLGQEPTRFGVVRGADTKRRFAELTERTGLVVPTDVPVGQLRLADQLKVEVLRALARDARVVILDEPTAYLMRDDAANLLDSIRALRDQGTAFVYISHFLDEVLEVADTVTVLRDGVRVLTSPAATQASADLIHAMTGREVDLTFPSKAPPAPDAPVVLSVSNLRSPAVHSFSLDVRKGEIVGLGGLVGSGRTEVARAIFGADPIDSGSVVLDGRELRPGDPARAIREGLALIPESRKEQALWLGASLRENGTLPSLDQFTAHGIVSRRREASELLPILRRLRLTTDDIESSAGALSGGNQQKLVFAKWLLTEPKILIADEPTRGIDVGAKAEIYQLLADLAAQGLGIVLISSEMEELIGLAHRIVVLRAGHTVAELDGLSSNPTELLEAAFTDTREVTCP